jgi:hypothetical protein
MKKSVCLVLVLLGACSNAQQFGGKVNDTSNTFQSTTQEGRKMWHSIEDAWDDVVNGKSDAHSGDQVGGGAAGNTNPTASNGTTTKPNSKSNPASQPSPASQQQQPASDDFNNIRD